MKMIEPQPNPCQIPEPTNRERKYRDSRKKFIFSRPSSTNRVLTHPWLTLRKLYIMPTTTTVDTKCGR